MNIPKSKNNNTKTFAVIIANEDYTLVPTVPMAGNDGDIFAQYCEQTLGLPKENILTYPNATYGKMIRAVLLAMVSPMNRLVMPSCCLSTLTVLRPRPAIH